jgi:hypothetical protein
MGVSIINLRCFLLLIESKIAGNKIKLVNKEINKVNEIKIPKAAVPPKLETENIENPKNKMTEV